MIINQFDMETGLSVFTESDLETELHAHPALELIVASKGVFTLWSDQYELKDITFGVVSPNQEHLLKMKGCTGTIILIEPGLIDLQKIFSAFNLSGDQGIFEIPQKYDKLVSQQNLKAWCQESSKSHLDLRVSQVIKLISDGGVSHLNILADQVHLSPSRLSHLFKAQLGISLRKYMIWIRLKLSVNHMINHSMHLTEAAHASGFHDLAHFSRQFKEMLGVSPSLVYNNSCIVQGL